MQRDDELPGGDHAVHGGDAQLMVDEVEVQGKIGLPSICPMNRVVVPRLLR